MVPHDGHNPVAPARRREHVGDVVVERIAVRDIVAREGHEIDIEITDARDPLLGAPPRPQAADVEIGEVRDSVSIERRAQAGDGHIDGAHAQPAAAHDDAVCRDQERGGVGPERGVTEPR